MASASALPEIDGETLSLLTTHGLDHLSHLPARMARESERLAAEVRKLSEDNYPVYIHNHDCVKAVHSETDAIEAKADALLEVLPAVGEACAGFRAGASATLGAFRRTRQTWQQHTALLQLLELPTLMDAAVRNDWHEEALGMIHFVATLERRHPPPLTPEGEGEDEAEPKHGQRRQQQQQQQQQQQEEEEKKIKQGGRMQGGVGAPSPTALAFVPGSGHRIIARIVADVRGAAGGMRRRLCAQLQQEALTLPQCLTIVGTLRRLAAAGTGSEVAGASGSSSSNSSSSSGSSSSSADPVAAAAAAEQELQREFLSRRDACVLGALSELSFTADAQQYVRSLAMTTTTTTTTTSTTTFAFFCLLTRSSSTRFPRTPLRVAH